ncbi:3-hydroxyacyl-CoA dehydrogenase NAD-binding domain-containing protein [[Pantoea] beijingensis]|nr:MULTISPECIES: 3-hydroxyacyl-CoA dehydrogenase NAD-binding domain-containing protein [Erwiniaceae]
MKQLSLKGKNVTLIGGGVIGASWATVFLSGGMSVTISDPDENIESKIDDYFRHAIADLDKMGKNYSGVTPDNYLKNIFFEKDLAKAVKAADYIQENAPERIDVKKNIWKTVEENAPAHTLFLSSSSGIIATHQSVDLTSPERLIIGHPFNPPHLLPLVEVVPGEKKDKKYIDQALAFYSALGKLPRLINKEVDGFVVNRLQSAIFKECVYLVSQGVVRVEELDDIVTSSIGIRWATGGPFLSFHLGGGAGGMGHFLEHLAPGMEKRWGKQALEVVSFDDKTKKTITDQVNASYGRFAIPQLEKSRDVKEISIMKILNTFSSEKE